MFHLAFFSFSLSFSILLLCFLPACFPFLIVTLPLAALLFSYSSVITLFVKQKIPLQNKMAECFLFACLFPCFYFWHVACADVYQRACGLWKSQCGKAKYYNMRTFLETMCPLTCGQCRISSFVGTHAR